MTTSEEKMREAFEAHQLSRYQYADISRDTDGRYWNDPMESEWETWQAAQAIETAAIMKCADSLDKQAEEAFDRDDFEHHRALECAAKTVRALIPQDGRTQLEEFGMKVAKLVYAEFVKYGQTDDIPKLRAIVTNLIGEK